MEKNRKKLLLEKQDEELVALIQKGNQSALETLFIRYKGLIYDVSYKFMMEKKVAQMYFDDLIDVAIESLIYATKLFNVGEEKSFLSFWWAITERHQKGFFQKTIDSRIFYYDPNMIENIAFPSLSDSYIDSGFDLSASIIKRIHKNIDLFSQDERCFVEYYILGYKPLEIAEFFNWNKSKLYRIRTKAIDKLNKIFKSN